MKKGGRATWTKGPDGENVIKVEGRFTNTAVRRFDGGGCWQQHLHIFQAIMKSNWWTDRTAALQLFAHLEGEALKCRLTNAGGRAGKLGVPPHRAFQIITIPRGDSAAGSIPAAVREMDPATFATDDWRS